MTQARTTNENRVAVVGASRGLGRGVATALADRGYSVLAIARSGGALEELAARGIQTRVGDATDPELAREVIASGLDALVLVAGAEPLMAPLSEYDWESFRKPFEVDARAAFVWLQAMLRAPTPPTRAIVFSSGAALHGSPLSGGYAGAKQTQRFLCRYAQQEAKERGLDVQVQCLLPQLNPNTRLGRSGIEAYAAKVGMSPQAFAQRRFGDSPLDPEKAGNAVAELLRSTNDASELRLTGDGLRELA